MHTGYSAAKSTLKRGIISAKAIKDRVVRRDMDCQCRSARRRCISDPMGDYVTVNAKQKSSPLGCFYYWARVLKRELSRLMSGAV